MNLCLQIVFLQLLGFYYVHISIVPPLKRLQTVEPTALFQVF